MFLKYQLYFLRLFILSLILQKVGIGICYPINNVFLPLSNISNKEERGKEVGNLELASSSLFNNMIKAGIPYVMVAPEQNLNDFGRYKNYDKNENDYSYNLADYRQNKRRINRYFSPKVMEMDFPSFGPGLNFLNHGGMYKRYVFMGKRPRDRYRMSFGLGKKRRRREVIPLASYSNDRNNNYPNQNLGKRLSKYSVDNYSDGDLNEYDYRSGNPDNKEDHEWNDDDSIPGIIRGRSKKRVDRYRMFFGLG
ncbi:unnamed protein product [Gordionus sp. m RMFG-2023]